MGGEGCAGAARISSTAWQEYQQALRSLCEMGATTAGYVDKPSANLVVRLLETADCRKRSCKEVKRLLPAARRERPLALPGAARAGRALGGVRDPIPLGRRSTRESWRCISSI